MSKLLSKIIWEERYRPTEIEDCILPKAAKKQFETMIQKQEMPNLLFYGPPGIGKTTTALVLCKALNYETLMINGSNEGKFIDTLRNKIANFASSLSLTGQKKCVIIDEADYLPKDTVQAALRHFINEYSQAGVKFIFTCNYPDKLIEPLHSRFAGVDFTIQTDEALSLMGQMAKRVQFILNDVGLEGSDNTVMLKIVQKHFPDMRRVLNEIQLKTASGTLPLDAAALSGLVMTELHDLVKFMANGQVKEIRGWIASQPYISMEDISRSLYENMYGMCSKGTMAQFITTLAEWQYKSSFMPDKEIAMMAMFVEILLQCDIHELGG